MNDHQKQRFGKQIVETMCVPLLWPTKQGHKRSERAARRRRPLTRRGAAPGSTRLTTRRSQYSASPSRPTRATRASRPRSTSVGPSLPRTHKCVSTTRRCERSRSGAIFDLTSSTASAWPRVRTQHARTRTQSSSSLSGGPVPARARAHYPPQRRKEKPARPTEQLTT
jgi:hypothetical protein